MSIVYDVLYEYFINQKWTVVLLVIVSFIVNAIQTGGMSYLVSTIIDGLEHNKYSSVYKHYKWFIVLSILFVALLNVSKFLQIKILTRLVQWMRRELFVHVLSSNNEEYTQSNIIKYNSPINRISYSSYIWASNILNITVPAICFGIIITAFFFYHSFKLGILFVLFNLAIWAYLYYHWKSIFNLKERYEKAANDNEDYIIDLFNNFDKIVYRGSMEEEVIQYDVRSEETMSKGMDYYRFMNKHIFIITLILYVSIFVYLGVLVYLRKAGKLELKIVITFITIILLYREHAYNGIQAIPEMMDFQGRTAFILQKLSDIKSDYNSKTNKKYDEIYLEFKQITFDHLSFKYKSGATNVVDDMNLVLNTDNKIIGLTGLSGKGKSTIMKMLMRMYTPTGGKILIDGVDIQTVDPIYIRRSITYVNQNSKLFDRKVIDNIMYGCIDPEKCDEVFRDIMKRQKIRDLFKNVDLKEGSSGPLGENLSGGQRQIVNMISGLVNPSKILILDEPTNALDGALKQEVIRLIRDYSKFKQCVIIITHDRDVYPLFDENITL